MLNRQVRAANVIDEFGREALAMRVARKLNSTDVIDVLTDLFILRGPPSFVRSDNGHKFVAKAVRAWIEAVGAKTASIEPGSPWENGDIVSFNARLRDELLDGEVFFSLNEAKTVIERSEDRHRGLAPALQRDPCALCVGLATACSPSHHTVAHQAQHALSKNVDPPMTVVASFREKISPSSSSSRSRALRGST